MQGGQRRDFVVLRMVLGIACAAAVGLIAAPVALANSPAGDQYGSALPGGGSTSGSSPSGGSGTKIPVAPDSSSSTQTATGRLERDQRQGQPHRFWGRLVAQRAQGRQQKGVGYRLRQPGRGQPEQCLWALGAADRLRLRRRQLAPVLHRRDAGAGMRGRGPGVLPQPAAHRVGLRLSPNEARAPTPHGTGDWPRTVHATPDGARRRRDAGRVARGAVR